MPLALVFIGAAGLVSGGLLLLLGMFRVFTNRESIPFRKGVATGITGTGIASMGFAVFLLGFDSFSSTSWLLSVIVGSSGVAQLLTAGVIAKLPR